MINLILIILIGMGESTANELTLDPSNRFNKMLVYINDDVPEGDGSLLQNIKDHLTKASLSLWTATGNMKEGKAAVQFGKVYIRVPKTWQVQGSPITWQQCNKANFYVATHRDSNNRTEPFTKQLGKCGEPAEFTTFSEEFFKTKTGADLVKAGKIIMSEFVKLRYGVFSEKPYGNVLTVFNGRNFLNSTCGPNISWTINYPARACSEKNKKCNYTLNTNSTHVYSVMFDVESPKSEYFCNDHDKPHNIHARSLQNIKCNRQSISSVILQHADFRNDKPSTSLQPTEFEVIKGRDRVIALVLDVSGSMRGIIGNMKLAAVEFVQKIIEDSESVGLAIFSDRATILSYANIMTSSNRAALISAIRRLNSDGSTNMGDGLAKGIQILGGNIANDDKVFGTIIILSDGENNREYPYNYEYAINQVIKKGVVVNTICYGNLADEKLNKLASKSGGQYVYADPSLTYSNLVGKFAVKQTCEKSNAQIKMIEDTITINMIGRSIEYDLVSLDKHIGRDIHITLSFTIPISMYTITLVSPSGKQIISQKTVTQSSGTTLTFVIPGIPEVGIYKVKTLSNSLLRHKRSVNGISLTFRVSATPEKNTSRIIIPTGLLSSSEIAILTDTSTIQATIDLTTCSIGKKESVTVNLTMITPSKSVKVMVMTDDGLGDDSIESDYIYTKLLIAKQLNEIGFYNFYAHVEIINTETKDVIKRSVELGSVRVKQLSSVPIQDKVPPARIEDLKVNVVSSIDNEISIETLATGNDGMIGNISNYEIKISSPNKESIIKTKTEAPPKSNIIINLKLKAYNVTNPFEIMVRGVDDNNNAGEWSLSKTSNWQYEEIAEKYSAEHKPGGGASNTMFSIICVSCALAASWLLVL